MILFITNRNPAGDGRAGTAMHFDAFFKHLRILNESSELMLICRKFLWLYRKIVQNR
jgi:hypothetical protein